MKGTDEITNSEDIIDSRDVIARIEYLESELQSIHEDADTDAEDFEEWLRIDDSDEARELKALRALAEQCEGYGDWNHGEALIRESHFEDYARQFAEDIGAIPDDAQWPCTCIDWQQAAKELQMDYSSVDFDGVEYLMRS